MSTTLSLIVGLCVTSQGAGETEDFAGITWFSGGNGGGISRRQLNTECGQDKIEYK